MTYQELIAGLSTLLPTTYGQWHPGQVPALPYLVLMEQGDNDLIADNHNYQTSRVFNIELYFDRKDPEQETKLEDWLNAHGLVFSIMADQYIPSERFFERTYTMTI